MTKRSVIRCSLSLLMIVYLVIALRYTSRAAAADTFSDLRIAVVDTARRGFVTGEDIDAELGNLSMTILSTRHDSLNTRELEQRLLEMDKVERANCVILSDGSLSIRVWPLEPVARIFDDNGDSYYINRAGKHMSSDLQYRIDVPVATGRFKATGTEATYLFPVLDHIASDPRLSAFITNVHMGRPGDIYLVPAVSGQVIQFGDTNDIANKFRRLETFYRDVLPHKGWHTYDTISVKWRGQVVAKRCIERPVTNSIAVEEFSDKDNISTITAGSGLYTE